MVPGHCWRDCNGRAYCEDDKCLCDYAFYGESCEERKFVFIKLLQTKRLNLSGKGYFLPKTQVFDEIFQLLMTE